MTNKEIEKELIRIELNQLYLIKSIGKWKDSEIDLLIEEYEEKLESIKQDTKPEIN